MDWLVEFLLGAGGVAIGAVVAVFGLGVYFLWRSSRKLGETT